ncbi:MAG: M42 family metallopeptidase [Candidatus Phytoplasma stylosanthis]|nr:M42 family metallopeptidase [Candidatus Phytoplasma stylosanthis]MDV3195956.1 M42 family metallopeptidase [Candidatus Phytoplasma stylosanthis]
MSNLLKKLKDLTMLNGVPGQEKQVNSYIKENIKDFVDKIEYDNLGSLIAYKGNNGPKIMLAGHVDEIGLMVTEITKEGFIKFQTLGGWSTNVMLAQKWKIHTSKGFLTAITGAKPPHVLSIADRHKNPESKDLFLDLGVYSKEEVEKLNVKIGDMITPYSEFEILNNEDFIVGKAFDNRVGALIVMEVLENLKDNQNIFVGAFTVQEEVGLRGARTSTNKIKPLVSIAIDTGIADDFPGETNSRNISSLGKGPQISCYDSGLIPHKGLRDLAIKIAQDNNIPFQEPKPTGGQTDASIMHLQNEGSATITISVPTRYIHSHTSVINKKDIEYTIELLVLLIKELDSKKVEHILFN